MISQKKFLEIIYEAATCFIPTDELSYEELDIFDHSIRYSLCDCLRCRKAELLGHASNRTGEIGVSRQAIKQLGAFDKDPGLASIILLQLIKTILHEIIHIIKGPLFSEENTKMLTNQWLNKFDWNEVV